MFLNIFLLLLGIVLIYKGADWLIDYSIEIAKILKISSIIIGVVLIAVGTSAPEIASSWIATLSQEYEIAVGNIVGSVIVNTLLVLGLSAVLFRVKVHKEIIKRDIPFFFVSCLLLFFLSLNHGLSRFDGLILTILAVVYYVHLMLTAEKEISQDIKHAKIEVDRKVFLKQFSIFFLGLGLLLIGSKLAVDNGAQLALQLGVSKAVVGLILIAFGTSIPELATSLKAGQKKHDNICLGNIVGSNIADILLGLGFVSMMAPIQISSNFLLLDMPFLIILAFIMGIFAYTGRKISKKEGIILLVLYVYYLGLLYITWIY